MPWEGLDRFGDRIKKSLPGDSDSSETRGNNVKSLKRYLARDRAGDVLSLYVDGSLFVTRGCRKTGWGWVLFQGNSEISKGGGSLRPRATIYDAEAWALAIRLNHTLSKAHAIDATHIHILCHNRPSLPVTPREPHPQLTLRSDPLSFILPTMPRSPSKSRGSHHTKGSSATSEPIVLRKQQLSLPRSPSSTGPAIISGIEPNPSLCTNGIPIGASSNRHTPRPWRPRRSPSRLTSNCTQSTKIQVGDDQYTPNYSVPSLATVATPPSFIASVPSIPQLVHAALRFRTFHTSLPAVLDTKLVGNSSARSAGRSTCHIFSARLRVSRQL